MSYPWYAIGTRFVGKHGFVAVSIFRLAETCEDSHPALYAGPRIRFTLDIPVNFTEKKGNRRAGNCRIRKNAFSPTEFRDILNKVFSDPNTQSCDDFPMSHLYEDVSNLVIDCISWQVKKAKLDAINKKLSELRQSFMEEQDEAKRSQIKIEFEKLKGVIT